MYPYSIIGVGYGKLWDILSIVFCLLRLHYHLIGWFFAFYRLMNDNMNEECSKSHAPMCLMLYLKPLRFAAILKNNSVETILRFMTKDTYLVVLIALYLWSNRTNETVLEILAKLSVIANSAQTQHWLLTIFFNLLSIV